MQSELQNLLLQKKDLEAISEKLRKDAAYFELELIKTKAKLDKKIEELKELTKRLEGNDIP
jgi:hypothetical protein